MTESPGKPEEQDPYDQEPEHPDYSHTSVGMTDADLRHALLASIRLLAALAIVAAILFTWRVNWQSGVLVFIGAAISAASLWEWLRMITAVNQRMDAKPPVPGEKQRPMGGIVLGFFTRLCLTLVLLYASLKYLHGTAFALAAGLGLGVVSLSFEAVKLMRRGTS